MDSAKISKKDIFSNPIPETSKEKQEKFECLSEKLKTAHQLTKQEQEDLLNDVVGMIVDKD
jgi:hypothetical protein